MMKLTVAAILSVALGATIRPYEGDVATTPTPTPYVEPTPVEETHKAGDVNVLISDGTHGTATGDNAVVAAANEEAGAAAAKGEEDALAVAGPGLALGAANVLSSPGL